MLMNRGKMLRKYLAWVIFSTCFTLFFCEYLIYFLVQVRCDWPALSNKNEYHLRALLLADTHLLGPYRGHWFDKLRREWQMATAFTVANTLHAPEAIFFLGDIFDEGQWVNQKQFKDYVERFAELFPISNSPHHVLVGNHDVGFHYMMDDIKLQRFYKTFNSTSADIITLANITFVTVNSMAMEGDDCHICKKAEKKISSIAAKLKAEEKPVLLQHFPLFRKSDEICQGEDSAPDEDKSIQFRPKLDCLSQKSSNWLLKTLKPRVIFSGHTHHGCLYNHNGIEEYSVPSFSWRNRNNPSYLLVTFSFNDYAVYKCLMPEETWIIGVYITFSSAVVVTGLYLWCSQLRFKRRKRL